MDIDDYSEDDFAPKLTLVEHVCWWPNIHTPTGSLEEVYSFINALKQSKDDYSQAKAAIDWFLRHAACKDSKLSFDKARAIFGSDAEALNALFTYVKQVKT